MIYLSLEVGLLKHHRGAKLLVSVRSFPQCRQGGDLDLGPGLGMHLRLEIGK